MLKKIGSILLVLIVFIVYSASAFAGNGDGTGTTTQTTVEKSTVGQKSGSTTDSALEGGNITAGGKGTTSGSSIDGESAATSGSAIDGEGNASSDGLEYEVALQNALKNGKAINNGEFFVTITSPDKEKDSIYKKTYILSGKSDYSDIIITIAKYNEKTEEYEPMYNTDGESSWEINSTGVFCKIIELTMGVNKIKIIASRASQKLKKVQEKDFQINCFTIERVHESVAEQSVIKTDGIKVYNEKDITHSFKSFIDFLFNKKSP